MRGNGWLAIWIGGAVLGGAVWADDAVDSLALIPGDAVGFVCVPNPQALDADVGTSLTRLGMAGAVPLPNNSVLALLEAQAPPVRKMDATRPLAVVFMPADTLQGLNKSQAMLIPCQDPRSLIDEFEGQAADNGTWDVAVMGAKLQAAIRDQHLILADGRELVQDIKDSPQNMADRLPPAVRESMSDLDVIIGINLARLSDLVTPLIEGRLFPLLDSQATTAIEKQSVRVNKQQIMRLAEGMETMIIGLRLEEAGLALRFAGSIKSGSELAKSTHMRVTNQPLLQGLPAEPWAIASGQVADETQMQAQIDNLKPMFEIYQSADNVDATKLSALQEALRNWMLESRGYQMAVTPLDNEGDGVVGVSVVAHCQDSRRWLQLAQKTVELAQELAESVDSEASNFLKAFGVASSNGTLTMDVDLRQIDAIDEDRQEMMEGVLGSDTSLRMKAVGPDRVLMSFGGGADRLASLEQAMAGGRKAESAGWTEIEGFLPATRNSVTYVFVDRTVDLVRRVLVAMGEEDLPFATPDVDVPVTISGTGGDDWWRADIVVPLEVIAAGRDISMTMMGQ